VQEPAATADIAEKKEEKAHDQHCVTISTAFESCKNKSADLPIFL